MKCVLVGNQNSGKSLLFNDLTGLNQKVGNWAGVTVEYKKGIIKKTDIEIVDLPGIYSLSPYSNEETITREYILDNKPDLIINVIDSTSFERSLYLTTQLLELGSRVLVVLNMEDILKKRGYKINIELLSKELGTTVTSVSALKKTGLAKLIDFIKNLAVPEYFERKMFNSDVEKVLFDIENSIPKDTYGKRFYAVKSFEKEFEQYLNDDIKTEINNLVNKYGQDTDEIIADQRYKYIEKIRDECVYKNEKPSLTTKIDKIILNKYLSIPIFVVIMCFIYLISVGVIGGLTSNLINAFFYGANSAIGGIEYGIFGVTLGVIKSDFKGICPMLYDSILGCGASPWAASLVSDGIFAGFGAVINFVPQLIMVFLSLSLLETVGYMSRITFLFDKFFKKIGMSGKSLVSFIVGSGCSVPGIMSCRTIEDKSERNETIKLTSFIPCSAKLPIISLISGSLFGKYGWLISLLTYFISIVLVIFIGYLLNKFNKGAKYHSFINELPEYHLPSGSYIFREVFSKTFNFIKKAGTIIVLCGFIVWLFSSFSWSWQYVRDIGIEHSMLAGIGNGLAWIYYPMLGFNYSWAATVSSIQGIVAKEAIVSTMQIIAKCEGTAGIFVSQFFSFFNPVTGFAFLMFNLFCPPCISAIIAMRKELGDRKVFFKTLLMQFAVGWIFASVIGMFGALL